MLKHAPKHLYKEFDPSLIRLSTKEDTDGKGTLEGYASIFGNIDLGGDVIRKGAFAKTLTEQLPKKAVKLMDSHAFYDGTGGVIGIVTEASEDDTGLKFVARLSAVQRAQDVRTKVNEGILNSLSIGFDILNAQYEMVNGVEVRMITEVKLYEISVVIWGMNPEAHITGSKTLTAPLTVAEKQFLDALKACHGVAATLAKDAPTPYIKACAERFLQGDSAVIDSLLTQHERLTQPTVDAEERKAAEELADLASSMRLYTALRIR